MNDDALMRTLAALRTQYLAEAPDRIGALEAVVGRLRAGDRAGLGELRHLLHRLAGSGGAYGLQTVTDTARAGERTVHAVEQQAGPLSAADIQTIAARVADVAAAFRAAGARV
jgi:chemotaxis protein histidine kinase CheA